MNIEFDERLFNPMFWEFKKAFADHSVRIITALGGSSASKTHSYVQSEIHEKLENPDSDTLILRKYAVDIRNSIYKDFTTMISDWNLNSLFTCQQNLIKCPNKKEIVFRGLDKPESIKGIKGFKRVVLEEANQFDFEDLKQIRKRLRGMVGQQIVIIFNPIDETHWLKEKFIDRESWIEEESEVTSKKRSESGKMLQFKTTYLDNKYIVGPYFVDQQCIDEFEYDKKHDYNYYRIYALGEWGKLNTGSEFYKKFDTIKNTTDREYTYNLPLHVSFDENVNPYMTATIWQVEGLKAWQIDEVCLPSPNNRIKDVCLEIKRRYQAKHNAGMFIYGDATSRKEDTKLEKGENFFTLAMKYLSVFKPSLRLDASNPSVVMRGNFINEVFENNIDGIELYINHKCKNSILDYKYLKEAPDGRKLKEKERDPSTKISYEKYGHTSDANDYLITKIFYKEYNSYINGNRKMKAITGQTRSNNVRRGR